MRIMKKQIKSKHIKHIHHKKTKIDRRKVFFWVIAAVLICSISFYVIFKDKVAATVYGEKIYEKRVDAVYNSLKTSSNLSKSQVLNQIIDMKLLAHYIEKQGYGLSDATFEDQLKKLLSSENKKMEDFEKEILLWGINRDDFKESMEISIFMQGVLENNQEAARNIIENERKTAEIKIIKEY